MSYQKPKAPKPPIKFGETPRDSNGGFEVQPASEEFAAKNPNGLAAIVEHKSEVVSHKIVTPAYHQRCPWLCELPIADLNETESIQIPFSRFYSDPRIVGRTHTTKVIELMRSNLRQFFEAEFPTMNHRLGTRVDKKAKKLIVYRRDEADLPTEVHSFRGVTRSTPKVRSKLNTSKRAPSVAQHVRTQEAKKLVEAKKNPVAVGRTYTHRPTLREDNLEHLQAWVEGTDTTISEVVNEIIEQFFNEYGT